MTHYTHKHETEKQLIDGANEYIQELHKAFCQILIIQLQRTSAGFTRAEQLERDGRPVEWVHIPAVDRNEDLLVR